MKPRMSRYLASGALLACAVATVPFARELAATRISAALVTTGLLPDSISGVRGQRHSMALRVDLAESGRSLGSYSVAIVWDSTVVRLDSVRAGDFGTPLVNYVNGGEVRLAQVNTTGMAGAFSLARLFFHFANDTAGRRTPIGVSFTDLVATDFTDLRAGLEIAPGVARILAPNVVVRFTPDSTHAAVGGRPLVLLTADLSAATGVALGSYAATFTWDSTVMVLDSVRAGDFVMPQLNQVNGGELRLTAADAQGRSGAPFSLARLFFRFVVDAYPRASALSLSVSEMHAALTFANLISGVVPDNGVVVIGGVLRGDIDIGGSVAALDAQLILQGVVGLTLPVGMQGLPNGDADCNGALQAKDAQIVLNQVVGNPVGQFCVARIQ